MSWTQGAQFEQQAKQEMAAAQAASEISRERRLYRIIRSTKDHLEVFHGQETAADTTLALMFLAASMATLKDECQESRDRTKFIADFVTMATGVARTVATIDCPCPNCMTGKFQEDAGGV